MEAVSSMMGWLWCIREIWRTGGFSRWAQYPLLLDTEVSAQINLKITVTFLMTANGWELGLLIGLAGKMYQNCCMKEDVDSGSTAKIFRFSIFFDKKSQFFSGGNIFLCAPHK